MSTATIQNDDVLSDEEILDDIYKKGAQDARINNPPPPSRALERDMVNESPVRMPIAPRTGSAPAKLLTKSEDGKPRLASLNTGNSTTPPPQNSTSNGRKPKYYQPVYSVKNRMQDKSGTVPVASDTSTTNTTPLDQKLVEANGRQRKDRNPQRRERGRGDRGDRGERRERVPNKQSEEQLRRTREEEIIRKREEHIMRIREEEDRLFEEERIQREEREKEERDEQDRKFREKEERERRIREREREKQLAKERLMKTRTLGDKATVQDLQSVVFSPSSIFETGEAVIVPRTRGGFTYGRIVQYFLSQQCYADNSVSHITYIWRVVYPNAQRDNLFKDLPAAYVGKLPAMYDTEQQPAFEDVDGEREVGQKPQLKDLHNAVFSPASKFAPNQMVLVPRSKGGFTYGRVVSECTFPCRLDEAHRHDIAGYRILVSPDNESKIRKDVLVGNLGKLYLPEQLQAALQAANEVAALTAPPAVTSRPVVGPPRVIRPPELPRDDEEGLEEEVGIMYPPAGTPITSETGNREVTVFSAPVEEPPKPKRGILEVPGLFAKPEATEKPVRVRASPQRRAQPKPAKMTNTPLIVVDGPNVAMKHGKKKNFSVAGLEIAIAYYTSRGFDVVAFVPEYMATRKANVTLGNSTLKLGDFMTVGDDLPHLLEMADEGLVVLTPPQDYDDSYCIEYAKKHNACIVTNDRYNDHIDKQKSERDKAFDRRFIREHCISFTFIRDEFMPNPDFVFPQDHPVGE